MRLEDKVCLITGAGSGINMSCGIAEIGLARRVSYAASKGPLLSMAKFMQVDCAP